MGIAKFLMGIEDESLNEAPELEAKESSIEKHSALFNEIRDLKPELYNVEDRVLNNLLTIYSREFNLNKNEIAADQVADWINDAETYGNLIFEYQDELALKNLEDLGMLDPKFIRAVTTYAKDNGFIDDQGRDLTDSDDKGKILGARELMWAILDDSCRSSANDEERMNNVDRFDDNLFHVTMDELKKIYDADTQPNPEPSLEASKEEPVEQPAEEPAAETEAPKDEALEEGALIQEEEPKIEAPAEEPIDTPEVILPAGSDEPSDEVTTAAYSNMINDVTNECWNLISAINSTIATLEYSFKGDIDSVKELLNDIVNDVTIDIGMLHKVSSIVDSKTAELINTGEDKAEEKVGE